MKIPKKKGYILAIVTMFAMLLSLMPAQVTFAATYKAEFGAQFDPTVNETVGEWPDLSADSVTFNADEEVTLTINFDAPVAFGENYVAINTDFPAAGSGKITSFKLDGNEVPMGSAFLNNEGIDGGLRLTICNKWNGDIAEQPVDVATLGEFSKIEITFVVTESAYTAQFGAQFNPTVNETVGEWPDLSSYAVGFNPGVESTIQMTFDEPVAFGENYAAIDTDFPYPGSEGRITSFKLDGNDISIGDVFLNNEGTEGGLRLTICNKWNGDIAEQPLDVATLGEFKELLITFIVTEADGTIEPAVEAVEPPTEEIAVPEIDLNGTYHAYLGIQSENFTFRNAWDDPSYGTDGSEWPNTPIGNNFNGLTGWVSDVATKFDGVFTDCEIKGNGTYRVSLDDYDFGNDQSFNLLFVSTDIPKDESKLTFSNVKVIMGGSTKHTFEEAFISADAKEHFQINCINTWDSDLKDLFGYAMPKSGAITVEFTVSGFAYDKVEEEAPAETEQTTQTTPAQSSTASPENTAKQADSGLPVWGIVLIVVGAAVVVCVVVIVIKKSKKK